MNPCLEHPALDGTSPIPDPLVADAGIEIPAPAGEADVGCGPAAADTVAAGKGRVLLIEDDAGFNEVTRDYLIECGYTVVAVQSGREGVREVLAGDFSLIFCDMNMPTMPGDMFYRAVERIRPQLCGRFVFMTGYRDDERTGEFIKQVGAYVLRKPFPLQHLVDSIGFIEVLNQFDSVCDEALAGSPPSNPAEPGTGEKPQTLPVARPVSAQPRPRAPRGDFEPTPPIRTAPSAPLRTSAGSIGAAGAATSSRKPARAVLRADALTGLAIFAALAFAALAVLLGGRYLRAWDGALSAMSERLTLEAEVREIAPQARMAEAQRGGLIAVGERAVRIGVERAAVGWAGALRAVTAAAGAEIQVRGASARGIEGPAGSSEIQIEGVAVGSNPREVADRFLQAMRRELVRQAPNGVSIGFEKLEDGPETSPEAGAGRSASFVLTARVSPGALVAVTADVAK